MWHHKCISSYSSFNFYKLFHPSSTEVVSPVFAWFTNGTKSEKFQTFFLCVLLFESSIRIWMTTHTQIYFIAFDFDSQSTDNNNIRSFTHSFIHDKKCENVFTLFQIEMFDFQFLQCSKILFRPTKNKTCVSNVLRMDGCTMEIHPVHHRFNVNQSISTVKSSTNIILKSKGLYYTLTLLSIAFRFVSFHFIAFRFVVRCVNIDATKCENYFHEKIDWKKGNKYAWKLIFEITDTR